MRSGGRPTKALTRAMALALIVAAAACSSVTPEPAAVRAMTYNIRLDTEADGENAWPHRRPAVAAMLRFYEPDIVGLQEVKVHQLEALEADLPAYRFIGVGRDDGVRAGEFSPLAFLKERYELIGYGQFWLSETPAAPSVGFDAAFPRLVTWAHLEDRRTRAAILALNTHFDHVGINARLEGAKLIRAFILENRKPCEAAILVGDFNATSDEGSYKAITGEGDGALVDARGLSRTPPFGPAGTFNGFDIFAKQSSPIDHIFVDKHARVARHGVITQHDEGRLPSDHYPVIADIDPPGCADGLPAPFEPEAR